MQYVAVYGTLKKGESNHHLLWDSEFIKEYRYPEGYLVDLGRFPGFINTKFSFNGGVVVEVYLVNDATINRLDWLEDVDNEDPIRGLYLKTFIDVEGVGECLIYEYNYHPDVLEAHRLVDKGEW
tara:strand:+ start:134 stop:505 length:372 start_codon:yes stop_codon:yes gene_type:complete